MLVELFSKSNWSYTCHNINALMRDVCTECLPRSVGHIPCFKGVCICIPPSDATQTVVIADVPTSFNASMLPYWVSDMNVIFAKDTAVMAVMAATTVTLGVVFLAAFVHLYLRYGNYKKLDKTELEKVEHTGNAEPSDTIRKENQA